MTARDRKIPLGSARRNFVASTRPSRHDPLRHRLAMTPSRLPVRVLRPSGARPGPTVAEAETGAGRSPPESCALKEGDGGGLRKRKVFNPFRRLRRLEGLSSKSPHHQKGTLFSPASSPIGGFKGGAWSRLPPRSAMDGRHWRPSPLCIPPRGRGLTCRFGRRWESATGA